MIDLRADQVRPLSQRSTRTPSSWRSFSELPPLTFRRLLNGSTIHSADFDMGRVRSALHLATCERMVLGEGAVCSLSRIPTRRTVAVAALTLAGLICVPGLALAAIVGDEGNRVMRTILLASVCAIATAGIAVCVRRLVDSYRWRGGDARTIVVSNVAVTRRGDGLGRSLLDAVTRLADEGDGRLVLSVRAGNVAARRLYRSAGFIETESNRAREGHVSMMRSASRIGAAPHRYEGQYVVQLALFALLGVASVGVLTSAASLSWSCRIAVVCALLFLHSAALVDLRANRLPNRLVVSAAAFAGIAVTLSESYDVVLIAAGMGAAPFLLVHLMDPSALGFGDVKYAATAGGLTAAWWWPAAVVMSLATLATACAVRLYRPHGPLPMGPSLFAGTFVACVVSIILVQKGLVS